MEAALKPTKGTRIYLLRYVQLLDNRCFKGWRELGTGVAPWVTTCSARRDAN
jgi:hypothetical protein